MAALTELKSDIHSDWKVAPNCALEVAATQHILNLKVTEIGKAVSNFPVFFTKMGEDGQWSISAVACLELDKNLFVKNGKWDATYMPTGLQTYPFFLMQAPDDDKKFTVGIEESNPAFSTTEGQALFESENKAGEMLSKATALLQDELKNEVHSYQFAKMLEELDLITPVDLVVQYVSGTNNSLKGLYTIDEAKLQSMDMEDVAKLRDKGYLAPLYAMLISIYQLNGLIRRHNTIDGAERIKQVKIETQKDANQAL